MKTFLNSNYPIVTAMLSETGKGRLIKEIKLVREQGADAYGLSYERLNARAKKPASLEKIIEAMSDKPIYFTNYLRGNTIKGITFEIIEEEMLLALKLGVKLIDVPADTYCMEECELSCDREAVERQIKLIERIHREGGEVLMSSRLSRFVSREDALRIAEEHIKRGADISLIVGEVNTEEELKESYEVAKALTERNIKYCFVCDGAFAEKQRLLAPTLGACMYFASENSKGGSPEPTLAKAKIATGLFRRKIL